MSGGKRKRGGERGGATSELRYPLTPPLGRGGEGRGGSEVRSARLAKPALRFL